MVSSDDTYGLRSWNITESTLFGMFKETDIHVLLTPVDDIVSKDNVINVFYTLAWYYQYLNPTKKIAIYGHTDVAGELLTYRDLTSETFLQNTLYEFTTIVSESALIVACNTPNTVVIVHCYIAVEHCWTIYVHDNTPYQSWRRFMHPNEEAIVFLLLFAQHRKTLPLPKDLVRSICGMLLDSHPGGEDSIALVQKCIRRPFIHNFG